MSLPALSVTWDPLHGLFMVPSNPLLVLSALAVLLCAPDPWLLLCPQPGLSSPSCCDLQTVISSGLLRDAFRFPPRRPQDTEYLMFCPPSQPRSAFKAMAVPYLYFCVRQLSLQ